jgi:A/G-specific adenine glycosylase
MVVRRVLSWYAGHARDLPWRRPEATPWAIMVSEFMLQQTPVQRVQGPWQEWLERWPTPAALAAASPADAVRAWGRLGYPRRALRLHQAAQVITNDFGGQVPKDRESLLRLPGVGSYTAAAISSFAYGRREIVLDTNVRRLLARIEFGAATPVPCRPRGSEHWLRSLRRVIQSAPPAGPLPRWSLAHWCVVPASRYVKPARCRISAPGRRPATPPGWGQSSAGRRTTGPIGNAAVPCSLCSAPATTRLKISS